MELNEEEIKNVCKLEGSKRYQYFIKRVADNNKLWGLYNDGWALVSDGKRKYLPIWSHIEFAKLNQVGDWCDYTPEVIELQDFITNKLPQMQDDGLSTCVFLTLKDYGVCPDNTRLKNDLLNELELYE